MLPQLALFISILLIFYLFWMDRKKIEGVSNAIWIPYIWMFLASSRYVSQWLALGKQGFNTDAVFEGSPLDRAVFTVLIGAGAWILSRRRINWNLFFARNAWVWVYFLFGAISFFWSDYPFVSFKRWIKAVGTLIMVLVVLTEERPYAAIGVILRRLAFVLLPLSVVFIRYYPHLGRTYHKSAGTLLFTGVADTKNALGAICLISGIYFSWNLLFSHKGENESTHRLHYIVYLLVLPMTIWLLYISNSATSWICMVVALSLFLVARHPVVIKEPDRFIKIGIFLIVILGILEVAFDLKDTIITMLGRRPDLTTRVPMWEDLLTMVKNPLIGFGYESFWLGERLEYMDDNWGIRQQAHNGYLEMYLNMGLIGVFFIFAWILSGLKKVKHHMVNEYTNAILRLCFIVVVALYNWTEATFFGNSTLWLLFFLGVMEIPEPVDSNIRNLTATDAKPAS
jgi:O-antigen ligase